MSEFYTKSVFTPVIFKQININRLWLLVGVLFFVVTVLFFVLRPGSAPHRMTRTNYRADDREFLRHIVTDPVCPVR
jgi:hypothetical protein